MDFGDGKPSVVETEEVVDPKGENPSEVDKVDNPDNSNEEPKNEEVVKPTIEVGSVVEFEGASYTASENGDLVDSNGNVFKKADEIDEWLKGLDVDTSDSKSTEIDIKSIQKAINIELVDENDKPIEFENTTEGLTSFIQNVIEQSREDNYDEGVKQLFSTYPVLQEVLSYYLANGNSLEGFDGRADRSDVEFDANNEEQHVAIIRTAWEESGRAGDVNGYIEYLKSAGNLASSAEIELNALKEADAKYKKELEEKAARAEAEQIEYEKRYWSGIQKKINDGVIGNYTIPEVISINRDGQKHNVNRAQFFDYLYRRDKEGYSRYQRDLENRKQEDIDNDQLIRAYLMFTGGSYDSLVDMAMKKKELSTLRLKVTKATSSVKINKPNVDDKDRVLDFGF